MSISLPLMQITLVMKPLSLAYTELSLIPRSLPDFVSQPWIFLYSYKINLGVVWEWGYPCRMKCTRVSVVSCICTSCAITHETDSRLIFGYYSAKLRGKMNILQSLWSVSTGGQFTSSFCTSTKTDIHWPRKDKVSTKLPAYWNN